MGKQRDFYRAVDFRDNGEGKWPILRQRPILRSFRNCARAPRVSNFPSPQREQRFDRADMALPFSRFAQRQPQTLLARGFFPRRAYPSPASMDA